MGNRLIFEDMMHYTMVKTTTFNGVHHPAIGCLRRSGNLNCGVPLVMKIIATA
ncbi:hypothetical protein NON20_12385 [Synechocystis sp. B12]|nr:hypothetical protein NON20_12385 [Synechocystis sp. B12]